MIFVIDDEEVMAKCVARAVRKAGKEVRVFDNAITAMAEMAKAELPEMILMEVMLSGPDGFTLLNELVSYPDTAKVPVVLVSGLPLEGVDLAAYGVVGVLNKDTMTPEEITEYARRY